MGPFGCAGKPGRSHVLALSCWGDTQEFKILGGLLKAFEAENPGWTVEIQRTPYDDYITKLLTQSAGGLLPDVLFMGVDEALQFQPRGLLEPLDGYIRADKDFRLGDYYPRAVEPFRFQGKLYAVPRDFGTLSLVYYNKDLFRRAGLAFPKDGWDWKEFLADAEALTKRDASGRVTCWGFVDDWVNPDPWVYSLGAYWADRARHPTRWAFDDPRLAQGLQYRADLTLKYRVTPSQADRSEMGGTSAADLFLNGRAAMFYSGIWKTPYFREGAKFQWDVAEFPKGPTGKRGFWIGSACYGISASSPHKDEAWKLVKFLTGEEAERTFASTGFAVPAMRKVAQSPAFLDGKPPLNKGMILRSIPDGVWYPFASNWLELRDSVIRPELDRVWAGEETAAAACAKIRKALKDHPLKDID
jgi:multiple sugar transport system substrate-binding protein